MALKLDNPDLNTDPDACWVMKDEVVAVEFAAEPGMIETAVGLNRYEASDALLTGSTGDRWCVSRDRFDAKYLPEAPTVHGQPGLYRNRPVAALVQRSAGGDVLHGEAGDWLVQYAPGDNGIVAEDRFARVYRLLGGAPPSA